MDDIYFRSSFATCADGHLRNSAFSCQSFCNPTHHFPRIHFPSSPVLNRPSLSSVYIAHITPHCFYWVIHIAFLACSLALLNAGINMLIKRAIIEMTTNNSISVKALFLIEFIMSFRRVSVFTPFHSTQIYLFICNSISRIYAQGTHLTDRFPREFHI